MIRDERSSLLAEQKEVQEVNPSWLERWSNARASAILIYVFYAFMLAETKKAEQANLAIGMVFAGILYDGMPQSYNAVLKAKGAWDTVKASLGVAITLLVFAALVYASMGDEDPALPPELFTAAFAIDTLLTFSKIFTDKLNRFMHAGKTLLLAASAVAVYMGLVERDDTSAFGYVATGIQGLFFLGHMLNLPGEKIYVEKGGSDLFTATTVNGPDGRAFTNSAAAAPS